MNSLPTFRRYPLLLEFLVVGVIISVAHYFASHSGLYYAVAATDVAMHFLGGLWVGLGALLFFFTSGTVRLPRRDARVVAVITIVSAMAVGLAWEVYELWDGLVDPVLDRADTSLDLVMDFLGAAVAFWYFKVAVAADETNAGL